MSYGIERVALQALAELARHNRDGLFVAVLFAMVLGAFWAKVSPGWGLAALVVCLAAYHLRRSAAEQHDERSQRLEVDRISQDTAAERGRGHGVIDDRRRGGGND